MEPTALGVLAAASLTALATGLGALPLAFRPRWGRAIADGNALAGGVMLAAAVGLIGEGLARAPGRAVIGVVLGVAGIVLVRRHLPAPGRLGLPSEVTGGVSRAVAIIVVMTAHSAAEGIGVGVAFAEGASFGWAIALAIAVHNIPEGLAISLVLVPRGVGVAQAAGWSILSSVPQPVLAVPAFVFVTAFSPMLAVGLGLAAGAMGWMVVAALAPEALRDSPAWRVGALGVAGFAAMSAVQLTIVGV